ncbi:hypothetical protein DVH05_010057 [Phytophthora capsici]|nr:hypothetical protein DVH05_010057 [Phytophthora capsici]
MIRDQTPRDYRPHKHMNPAVIERVCTGYPQLKWLQQIVTEGQVIAGDVSSSEDEESVRTYAEEPMQIKKDFLSSL